jgi:hypothetical protein
MAGPTSQVGTGEWDPNIGKKTDPWAGVFEAYGQAGAIGQQVIAGARDPRAGTTVTGPTRGDDPEDTWRHRLYAEREASKARAAGTGGYAMTGAGAPEFGPGELPEYAIPEFKGPEGLEMPDYAPPEREAGREKALRREAMGAGMRQMRRRTQEAIVSAQSIDNPAARGKFVADVLQGMGAGLEQVSAGAARQAMTQYNRERQEALTVYHNQYSADAREVQTAYDTALQAAVLDFGEQSRKAQMEYSSAIQYPGASTPSGSTGTSRPRFTGNPRDYNKWFAQTYQ